MNHTIQSWNQPKSSSCKKISSAENLASPIIDCSTWRTKMLVKVKECRDAIKNMMTFDKLPNNVKTRVSGNSTIPQRTTTSVSSIPDIIRFSSIALKYKDCDDEPLLTKRSMSVSNELENSNISDECFNEVKDMNDSFDRFVFGDQTNSSSLQSFLTLEKQINDEYLREDCTVSSKKKISAEPFLSYTEGVTEFVWTDDTLEDSSIGKTSDSLMHSNSSDIDFDNSKFNESSLEKKNRTSSPIRRCLFYDSSFENNFSL